MWKLKVVPIANAVDVGIPIYQEVKSYYRESTL